MGNRRIHRSVSADGTEIAGHVEGAGPALVLVHGSLEDGDLCWEAMLPHLHDRFTCYLPSTRNRGLSGHSTDLAPQRRIEDVVSFVDSIGEPVLLVGESDGATLALGAAASSDAVTAVAVYESVVFEVADAELDASLQAVLPRVERALDDGRSADAARIFCELLANADELAGLADSDYLHRAGRYMPVFLRELDQASRPEAASPTDPSVLARIEAPVLLLHGARAALHAWSKDGAGFVAEHVDAARVDEVDGAGHFGVLFEPGTIADQLADFLERVPAPT